MTKHKKLATIDAIRCLLLEKYLPGDCLSEAKIEVDLAETYALEVSRSPIRLALNALESERLLVIKPQQGTIVRYITPDEVAEIHSARLANELWCVGKLAKAIASGEVVDFTLVDSILADMKAIAIKRKRSDEDRSIFKMSTPVRD
ncbi:MAG: GntR family transcriptional regulator [Pirellulaceae bacterium]|nr:GntR family transcriptional regulator [Pirellulaceae bacterium]